MKSISNKKTWTRVLFVILTISCMVMIFYFSSQDATNSSQTSGKVVRIILKTFVPHFSEFPIEKQNLMAHDAQFIVRKAAHFSIYALLGFCVSFAFGKRKFFTRWTFEALLVGFLYAVSDEMHQSYVPGRSCELRDVIIDTCGTITGILLSFAMIHILFSLKTKLDNKKRKQKI